jgi:hypothetical protein
VPTSPDQVLTVALTGPYAAVAAYLSAHSNLPGPAANLTLLKAAGEVLDPGQAAHLRQEDDEYLRSCGVMTLGRTWFESDPAEAARLLTQYAADPSWRVREAVAMAAQRIGDHDRAAVARLVGQWAGQDHPLVLRAAVAAICEPRLLSNQDMAAVALATCQRVTAAYAGWDPPRRHHPDARTLRQALGYCWSVAVAADPAAGWAVFQALDTTDADLAWIGRSNRAKARLKRLLPQSPQGSDDE